MAETKPQQLFTESQIEEFRHAFEFFDKVRNITFIFVYYLKHINALSIVFLYTKYILPIFRIVTVLSHTKNLEKYFANLGKTLKTRSFVI